MAAEKQVVSITFKTDLEKRDALDRIAQELDRDRTYILNESINRYLELYEWQLKQLDRGLEAANKGEFSTEEEIQSAIAKWML